MPNVAIAFASKRDSVKLDDKFVLIDVLCVPSLHCNLISIAQLIDDLCCTITFTCKLCVIHDLTKKVPIGSVSIEEGSTFTCKGQIKRYKSIRWFPMIHGTEEWCTGQIRYCPNYLAAFQKLLVVAVIRRMCVV